MHIHAVGAETSPQIRGGGRCQSDLPKQAHGPVVTPLVDRLSWRGEGKISSRSLPRAETRRYDTHQWKLEGTILATSGKGPSQEFGPQGVANRHFMGQSERGVLVNLSSVSGILSLSDNQRARVPMKGWPGTAGFDESSQELKVCQGGPFAWPLARDFFSDFTHSPCSGRSGH